MAQTANERKKKENDKKRADGYVPMLVWVKPEWKRDVKKFIEELHGLSG